MASSKRGILPGFGLTLGFSLVYLGLLVLIPLCTLLLKTSGLSLSQIWEIISAPRAVASYELSLLASLVAASVNVVFGVLVAWVLVRYRFYGRGFIDALVDLPFALPTAVGGIALTTLYSEGGFLGRPLAALGLKVAYTPLGVVITLIFIGLPFVVRTVEPVLQSLDPEREEAATTLGANRVQIFFRVIWPEVAPAALTGFALAFARALGEYGSVVFISGNLPLRTEITPLLIMNKLEQYDYPGATALALVMLLASFSMLLIINRLQRRSAQRGRA